MSAKSLNESPPPTFPPSLKGSENSPSEEFTTYDLGNEDERMQGEGRGLEATEQIKEQNTIRTQMQLKNMDGKRISRASAASNVFGMEAAKRQTAAENLWDVLIRHRRFQHQ